MTRAESLRWAGCYRDGSGTLQWVGPTRGHTDPRCARLFFRRADAVKAVDSAMEWPAGSYGGRTMLVSVIIPIPPVAKPPTDPDQLPLALNDFTL